MQFKNCKTQYRPGLLAKLAIAGGSAALAVASAVPAQALTIFDTFSEWQAASKGNAVYTETFDTGVLPANAPLSFADGRVTASRGSVDGDEGPTSKGFIGVIGNSNFGLSNFDEITWSFDDPNGVRGFFADYQIISKGLQIRIDDGEESIDVFNALGNKFKGDFGFIVPERFNTVTFFYTGKEKWTKFAVDDLTVAVPTPALLPGLLAMGIGALRKKQNEAAESEA